MTLWYDDGDGVKQSDEEIIAEGTAAEVLGSPIALDSDRSEAEQTAFDASETHYVGIKWDVPRETGNVIQSDSFGFDAVLYTEQARHNENPETPFQ
jgi:hypothetical protein